MGHACREGHESQRDVKVIMMAVVKTESDTDRGAAAYAAIQMLDVLYVPVDVVSLLLAGI